MGARDGRNGDGVIRLPDGNGPDEPPVDLFALDPTADEAAFANRVERILAAAGGELDRRRRASGWMGEVASWRRWALPAAAAIALASLATLSAVDREARAADTVAAAAGGATVPAELGQWVWSDETPSTGQLLILFEEDR